MLRGIMGILLASVAVPAFAADMPVKAPPPAAPIVDWSGVYTGIAAGGAWGHQNFGVPSSINNLFGTNVDRIFNGTSVLLQPDFDLTGACGINGCNRFNTSGFIGGGFAGVQKQWGSWVIGIEGSWDWTSMKKSLSATSSDLELVTRILPTTPFTIPAQTVTVPGQTAPVTVTGAANVPPESLVLRVSVSGLAPATVIPAGTPIPFAINSGGNLHQTNGVLVTTAPVTANASGVATFTTGSGGNISLPLGITTASFIGTTGTTAPVSASGTATIAPVNVTIPAQTVNLPIPQQTTVAATVTRSIAVEAKVDQIADIRGKIGFASTFMGPNWLFYFTGGAAVGHVERSLTLTQTVSVAGDGIRTNTFSSTAGDTRLGWVAGVGFDWKMTPSVLLGVLYRHHEFPKGTVSFVDDSGGSGRPISFGTNRATVDSVQGRLSVLFPIQ
jgi:opacity protein-like surface antigen